MIYCAIFLQFSSMRAFRAEVKDGEAITLAQICRTDKSSVSR